MSDKRTSFFSSEPMSTSPMDCTESDSPVGQMRRYSSPTLTLPASVTMFCDFNTSVMPSIGMPSSPRRAREISR